MVWYETGNLLALSNVKIKWGNGSPCHRYAECPETVSSHLERYYERGAVD